MIDAVDLTLRDWIGSVLESTPVSFDPPTPAGGAAGVGLYLLELAEDPPPRGRLQPSLQVRLRYLVTTWAGQAEEAHRMLGTLLFAALDREDMEVDLTRLPMGLWRTLGIPPRPAFILQVPLRRERPAPRAPRVRQALITRTVPATAFTGQVLGPGDVPVAGALVEIPGLNLLTEADPDGRFRFARIPAEPRPVLVRVRARGEVRSYTVEPTAVGEPVTIRFHLGEG